MTTSEQQGGASSFVPVLPMRNVVIYPGNNVYLSVGRPKSVTAVKTASRNDQLIVAIAQKVARENEPHAADLYQVGTLCRVEKITQSGELGYQVLVHAMTRVAVVEIKDSGEMLLARTEPIEDHQDVDEKTRVVLVDSLKALAKSVLQYIPVDTSQLEELIDGINDAVQLCYLIAERIDAPLSVKQEYLEVISVKQRLLRLLELLQAQMESLKLQHEIREKLTHKIGRAQRDHILREQLKTIREELGEGGSPERDDMAKKIEDAGMPEQVKKVALEELDRLTAIGGGSPEAYVIQGYLDLLVSLPWRPEVEEPIDLSAARTKLEADHYGLEKIKSRILQHLAVMKLKQSTKGTILLFVGPPGVGKTSLGQSIAHALERKFARASLGGVRDEAEIRGHRRTYIGAIPGRIIQTIKRIGTNNPVFMLDEIDKIGWGGGYSGDPYGALLEVLDPEQNMSFHDHFLDVPFDLSRVIFIATANTTETIPPPLLDRMEVIELSGYTANEKFHIARRHLIPKQFADHGLSTAQIAIEDDALMRMISHYTREAGVRELSRMISTIARVLAEQVMQAGELPVRVTLDNLKDVLGEERFVHEVAEAATIPGVATGLAWTPQGGEILFVEAIAMPGSGKLTLTGQLGEVMKESAEIALSLVRSHLDASTSPGIKDFSKTDIHIHVPQGAIPKDGPSAGSTMLTALASLCTQISVVPKLAMTGEITLRGIVMPVGGIKEKVLAAHRSGIEHVVLPRRNEKDLKEIPQEVREKLRFSFVETIYELIALALAIEVTECEPHAARENESFLRRAGAF